MNDEIGSLTQSDAKAWFGRIQTFCEDSFSGKLEREIEESAPAFALASLLHQNQRGNHAHAALPVI